MSEKIEKIDYDPSWLDVYPHESYQHPGDRWPSLVAPAGDVDRILDIGGGQFGVVAYGYWTGQRKVQVHVLDLWPPATMIPNFTKGNALDAIEIYGEKSFDLVQMTEVLEHMTKDVGYEMLNHILPALARKMILVTTPCGYSVQNQESGGNPLQKHISGWTPAELADCGFTVLINGPERAQRWREVEQQHDRPQQIGWKVIREANRSKA